MSGFDGHPVNESEERRLGRRRGRPRGPVRDAVLLKLPPDLLARIDKYKEELGYPTRMLAMEELLVRGLGK